MAEEDLIWAKNRHMFGGIEPSHMKSFSIISKTDAVKILAVLPNDTIVNGQTLCVVDGAIIRRRADKCPVDEFDGDLVADIKESGIVTDSTADLSKSYYYAAFPYSSQGVYNRSKSNRVKFSPSAAYYIYGFDLDTTNPDPDTRVTYPSDVDNELFEPAKMNFTGTTAEGTFSYGTWPSTPGEGFMPRPCIVEARGYANDYLVEKVQGYLMPDDYNTYVDGSAVEWSNDTDMQAMMEWPKIYTKRELVNGVYKFRCSSEKIDDTWECWCNYGPDNTVRKHFYTSIYKRTSLREYYSNPTMYYDSWSTNIDHDEFNNTYFKPANNHYYALRYSVGLTANQYFAGSRGENGRINNTISAKYAMEPLCDHLLIQDLLIMMSKTTDLKAAYGDGWTETTESVAGELDEKGMFYGAPQYTDSSTQTGRIKVFGMEDYWDSQYSRYLAGLINDHGVLKIKLTPGTKDGTTVTGYNTTGEGYLTVSDTYAGSGGYISECEVGSYGRIPIAYSGSETTYECDYISGGNQAVYFALISGSLNGSKNRGPFSLILNREPDYSSDTVIASMRFMSQD